VGGSPLTLEQRQMVHRLRGKGFSWDKIARAAGCSLSGASTYNRTPRLARPTSWVPRRGRLTIADREEILIGLARGETFTGIADRIGKAPSTVSREVAANGGRHDYRAWDGHVRARELARRPKPAKMISCPRLLAQVVEGLEQLWSPEEISRRLRLEHPDDPMMWVSHETIYQSLYVQGKGELRRELARCLRSGRAQRRPRGPASSVGKIPNMVMISEG
jgi:transposase, IS30 family